MDPVVATTTGGSAAMTLLPGKWYKLSFVSAATFSLDLQELSGDGTTWVDSYRDATQVVINPAVAGPRNVIVCAGSYRMDVNSLTQPITMTAKEI